MNLRHILCIYDGAPSHNAQISRLWIRLNGPIAQPTRSPDINPEDFLIWGGLRGTV